MVIFVSEETLGKDKPKDVASLMADVKNPEYWEGVFDTLHLIHSYFDHYEDHSEAMKPKQYVMAAKRAVRRRCKSCLVDLLDLPFDEE
jgi:hypothetical protein